MNRRAAFLPLPLALGVSLLLFTAPLRAAINTSPPVTPVKLIFIHHSSGENWLGDDNGGLGLALRDNNYFVSDTNYGWGPDSIGDLTDIGHWYNWFVGPSSATYLSALYAESGQHAWYTRLAADPGGANRIVMFKSCFPNAYLGGNPTDPATVGENPLRGQDAYSSDMTVANAKGIYNDLLPYFAAHQEKLFVVVTFPPLVRSATDDEHAANARAFTGWLVNEWLAAYPHHNVAVFDFFNVLTSSGGNTNTNDAGAETGNHHRIRDGWPQHLQTVASDVSAYGSSTSDSHATAAGNRKATQEFPALLNTYYHCWAGSGDCPTSAPHASFTSTTPNGAAPWLVRFTDLSAGNVTGWEWDFGDTGTSHERNPAHLYTAPGTYTVTLTVTGTGGPADTATATDYVTASVNPYTVSPSTGSVGTLIDVTGPGLGNDGGTIGLRYRDGRGRLVRKLLKVQSWAAGHLAASVRGKVEPSLADLDIRPRGGTAILVQNVFTAMLPAIGSVTPTSGAAGASIAVAGRFFGTDRPQVRLGYMSGGRARYKLVRVTAWAMDPATGVSSLTFLVPAVIAPGTYGVSVASKIGATVAAGALTVP